MSDTRPRPLPVVTFGVLAACAIGYALELRTAGFAPTPRQLHELGAVSAIALQAGEWWRIATSTFLHTGPAHVVNNVVVIALMGFGLERFLGHLRTLLVVVASAACAAVGATVAVDPGVVTVGASGIGFGLLAAAVVGDRGMRDGIGVFGAQLLAFNLLVTFTITGISVGGHLGGAVSGALVALERRLRTPAAVRAAAPAAPATPRESLSYAPTDTLELREGRAKAAGYLVVICTFTLLGAWVGTKGEPIGWLMAVGGGLGVVAQLRTFASPGVLTLTPQGLQSSLTRRRVAAAWSDIDVVMPAEAAGQKGVAWRWRQDSERSHDPGPHDNFLPNQFNLDHVVLAVLLESWRKGRHLRVADVTPDIARATLDDVRQRL